MDQTVQNTFFIVDKTVKEMLHSLYALDYKAPIYSYIDKKIVENFIEFKDKEDAKQDLYCVFYEMLTHTDASNMDNLKYNAKYLFNMVVSKYIIKTVNKEKMGYQEIEQSSIEDAYYFKEIKRLIIFSCNNKIPIMYRYVIYLYYYKDMSINKIATLLNKDKKTIHTYFHQAHEIYKKIL